MVDKIEIKALTKNDVDAFMAIRLEALKNHPQVYCNSYDKSSTYTQGQWEDYLSGNKKQVFGLYINNQLEGITGVFTSRDDPTQRTANFGMSYIREKHRRKGYAALLYESRINWAKTQPHLEKIEVSHREGNVASQKAMQTHGFICTGTELSEFGDGTKAIEYKYELKIKP